MKYRVLVLLIVGPKRAGRSQDFRFPWAFTPICPLSAPPSLALGLPFFVPPVPIPSPQGWAGKAMQKGDVQQRPPTVSPFPATAATELGQRKMIPQNSSIPQNAALKTK